MSKLKSNLVSFFLVLGFFSFSQNETAKWYFGNQAGLDFMTSPPSILTNGVMNLSGGSACMASSTGNLLFYTNGATVWCQTHTVMANGSGLTGSAGSYQNAVIAKQPGNANIYYIFTQGTTPTGLQYSVVDMSLAAGMGSVTIKNSPLTPSCTGGIAAVKHCNGSDVWVVVHDYSGTNFRAFLLTSTGVSTTSVNSPVVFHCCILSYLKCSQNGKKLAAMDNSSLVLFDFNNSSGVISNSLSVGSYLASEFSPDGTKLYATMTGGSGGLHQWDLCAGSPTAFVASHFSVAASSMGVGLQLARDGKIYAARSNQSVLGVINNPNNSGSACNYVNLAQSIAPKVCNSGLPNFVSGFINAQPPPLPFTHTVSNLFGCQTASFTAPPIVQNFTQVSCAASGYSLTGYLWNFGDPLSGTTNTSGVLNPSHAYTSLGTYTAQLILYYSCTGANDTIKQVVNVNQSCISVSSTSITCANLGSATVTSSGGVGPFSYTWTPTAQTGSVATGLMPGTYTISVFDAFTNFTYTATTTFIPLIPLSGSISASQSITCNAANTGTGSVTNLAGGSGNQSYLWSNGSSTSSVANPNNLSAGNWSVTVVDGLTACQIFSVLSITQPPALTLNITSGTPTACVGSNIILTGINSGGTPGYSYTWTAGPPTSSFSVSEASGGTYVYTLNSTDALGCLTSTAIAVDFVNNPILTVSDVSICPGGTGTLSVTGASTYTWNSSSVGSTFTASPVGTQQYAVTGSALGCTSIATASVIVKPIPSPTISNNSPICNAQTLLLSASGGTSYLWSGPLSFVSSVQNPIISSAAPNRSGVYNLTVTAANSCTAPASTTVLVNATPTISMSGGPVCLNSNLYLSANSFTGSSYFWSGPNSFTSSIQNPTITTVTFSATGNYSLLVMSAASCSNNSVVGVTVNPLPTITITPSGTVICSGKSSTLTASGGFTYLWNASTSLSTSVSSATVFVASPTISTSYTVLGTSVLGCTNTAVKNISVNVLPSVSVVVNPTVYCAGKSSTLSASGASTYTWSTNASGSSIVTGPLFTSFYNVRGTSAVTGCSNTAFATVSVNPLPSIVASTTKSIICTGTAATITAGGANTYTWLPGNSSASMITPSPLVNTTYTVRGTISASGCSNTAIRTISVNTTPTVSMVSNTTAICIGKWAIISASGASTYTLNPGNLTGNNFTVSPTATTQFSLVGTNSVNCVNLIPSNISVTVHNHKAIQGVVTSTTGQNNGNVVLYGYKPVLGKWDSLNTSLVILNNYNFPAVPSGSYVVKSFPFPTDLVETYGLSASSWKGASVINHNCLVNSTQNINIITFNNLIKSKATLSGKITQGAGYANPGSPGAAIPNITVKAGISPGPRIYQTTKTNAAGQYTLVNLTPNLSGENYYILVDIPALDTNKTYHRIIITGFENFTNLDFVVDSQRIHPLNLKVGVKELNLLNSNIKVYPNPASDQISIELELNKTEEMSIDLYDLSGRKIKTLISLSQQDKGKLTVLAKVEEMAIGNYLLKIRIGAEEGVVKLVIDR